MKANSFIRTLLLCAALTAILTTSVQAQTANWIGPATGGEWNTAAGWDVGVVPGVGTNAIIGAGTNLSYTLPMTATSFGPLTEKGVLNVNTNGFNNTGITMINPAGTGKLFMNTGAVVNVSGNLAFCSNSVVSMTTGTVVNVSGSLIVGCGSTGGTGSATPGSFGTMTNNGGTLNALSTSLNPGNGSLGTSALLVINGGTNNLGTVTIKRSNAGSGGYSTLGSEGLIINGGVVTMTNANVGGASGNSFLTMLIAGGTVTNAGSVFINQGSSARGSRLLQTGGLLVVPDPAVVNPNPTVAGSLNVYAVLGGTNIVGGIYLGNSNSSAGTVSFTNGATIFVGSQGIASNGVVLLTAVMNAGALFGATAPWTSSIAMKLVTGIATFQTADAGGNPNNITLANVLTGAGSLNATGAGILTLGATNTFSGNTLISGGTLALGSGGALASLSIQVGNGTTFDVSQVSGFTLNGGQIVAGFGTVTGAVTLASLATVYPGSNTVTGTLTFQTGITENGGAVNQFNLSSNPTGPGNDFLNDLGSLNLSGVNNVQINGSVASGGIYPLIQYGSLSGGIANLNIVGATGYLSNSVTASRIYFVAQAATRGPTNTVWVGNPSVNNWDTQTTTNWLNGNSLDFFVAGDNVLFSNKGASNGLVNLVGTVTPGSVTVNTTSNYTFTGTGLIGGSGSLTVSNGGVTILTTNIYTGPTILAGGVLATPTLANSGSPSGIGQATSDPANLVFNGGMFSYFGGSTGTDHGITLTNSGGTIDVTNSTTLTLNGVVNGNGVLTLVDSGTLVMANGNGYTGGTIISNGVFNLNNVSGAGSGSITLAGGTLSLTVGAQPSYANNLIATANSTLNSAGGNNNILAGTWAGGTNVTVNVLVSSSGTLSINGNMTNFYGTVELGSNTGFLRFNAGGGNTQFGGPNALFDIGTSTATLEARNPGTMALGALAGASGTFLKGPTSTAGTLTWQIGSSTNLPNSIYYGNIATTGNANEINSLSKVGNGTLTLAGQNTYPGPTTVNSGVLALAFNPNTSADGSINNSATINIVSGATFDVSGRSDGTFQVGTSTAQLLEGRGTITGSLNTGGASLVAPGGGPGGSTGTLTVTNAITLGGTAWMKLNRANTPNSDRLVSSLSTVTYGGTLVVTNIGAPLQVGDTFTLFSGGGLSSGTFSAIVLPNYYLFNTSQLGVNGSVTVTNAFRPKLSLVNFSGLAGGTVVLNATNGVAGGPVQVLTSTNLTLPLIQWTTNSTTTFDGSGNLTGFSITVDPTLRQQFIRLQVE